MRTIVLLASLMVSIFVYASDQTEPAGHAFTIPDQVKWMEGPPSLEKGAKFAVLEGDPSKEGLFTLRLWLPDGFKIQPHWHPAVEHVTVISGEFNIGMGDSFDGMKGQKMPQGAFVYIQPRMIHYAWTKGETILQLHGAGPWQIVYVNPQDDPRKK